jgi:hypothetical protein
MKIASAAGLSIAVFLGMASNPSVSSIFTGISRKSQNAKERLFSLSTSVHH